MINLHLKYPKEHLQYAKWLAYVDEMNRYPRKRQSWSDEITWNDLSKDEREQWLNKAEIGFFVYLMFTIDRYRKQFVVNWKCPICNYESKDAPENHHICHNCLTHFDYEDCAYTVDEMSQRHAELKEKYLLAK